MCNNSKKISRLEREIVGGITVDKEEMLELKNFLEERQERLPEFVEKDPVHWVSKVYVAKVLKKYDRLEDSYKILRSVYEANTFRYNKDIHGVYEDYIEEKVNFFKELARLSMIVTEDARRSIPYLDEALIMLDGMESVHPYINPKEIEELKEVYQAKYKVKIN